MTTCTLAAALLLGAPTLKEKPKAEEPPTGEWIAERVEQNGTDLSLKLSLIFSGDKVTMRVLGMDHTISATFDPAAKVKEITLDHEQPRGPLRGIYKWEGDTLTICLCEKANGPRPTEFSSKIPDTTLFILKRAPKRD